MHGEQGPAQLIINHFNDLFTSNGSEDDLILRNFTSKVTIDQNANLLKPYEAHEVKAFIFLCT